MSLTMTEI